ncbi:MAG: 50S ribosomal protein L24 [Patescibacteria group bacterium]
MKVKKGDTVLITAGKDRGRTGKILKSFLKESVVLVEGINLKKKHVKAKKQGEKGQVISTPAPLNISNVKIICPKCGKATRVEYKMEKGEKRRICKKCKSQI